MKKLKFNIPIYGVNVTLIQVECKEDKENVFSVMRSINTPSKYFETVEKYIDKEWKDGGDTFYNFDLRTFLVIFYKFSSDETRADVYSHEKRHIEDRVMEYANVNDIESAGLLAGFLGTKFYKFWDIVKKK